MKQPGKQTLGEMLRFVIVGVIATALHYGIYLVLQLKINASVSYAIGYILSFLCNYYLSARFTFKSKTTVKNGIGFCFAHGFNFVLHLALLNLFLWLGLRNELAPLPVFCIAVPVNFLMVRFVFKSKRTK